MKRLLTALSPLSDETEPVTKRVRLSVSSLSPSFEINENINTDEFINLSDSQSEHDDNDIPETVHENMNNTCQQIDNTIITISDSDSDDDQSISFTASPLTDSVETDEEEEEINIEDEHALIDLTEEEPHSSSCLSNKLKHKSSIDVERCPICLESLSDLQSIGVYLIITQCHHVMCTLCSQELLATSSRCPLCRKNITSTTLIPYCILT